MKNLITAMLLCSAFAVMADVEIPVKKNSVYANKDATIESIMDDDGMNSIQVSKQLTRAAAGNEYIDFFINLPATTDLTGKAIQVTILSENPENIGGFYVRAWNVNDSKKAVSSHYNWGKELLTKEYKTFTVVPGKKSDPLLWEPKGVNNQDPTQVKRLSIHTGSPKRNVKMSFRVKSVKIVDSPYIACDQFFAPVAQFSGFDKNAFTAGTQAEVKDGILRVYGKSPAQPAKPKATMYQGINTVFAAPVDLTGKKVSFEYRVSGPVGGIYFRGYDPSGRKSCFSFVITGTKADWQKVVLPMDGAASGKVRFEKSYLSDLSKVASFQIIFPVGQVNSEAAVEIRNLSIED